MCRHKKHYSVISMSLAIKHRDECIELWHRFPEARKYAPGLEDIKNSLTPGYKPTDKMTKEINEKFK